MFVHPPNSLKLHHHQKYQSPFSQKKYEHYDGSMYLLHFVCCIWKVNPLIKFLSGSYSLFYRIKLLICVLPWFTLVDTINAYAHIIVHWIFADFFSKLTFSKNSFRNTIGVSNSLDPDRNSEPIFCRSWSGSKLFAKVISRRQVTIWSSDLLSIQYYNIIIHMDLSFG